MVDWLIQNAWILDGSGGPAFWGDAAVAGGRVAAVGNLRETPAAHVVDAAGRTLTPGFLDIHRHGDAALFRPDYGKAELMQGITTVVNGNCGMSAAPVCGGCAEAIRRYLSPVLGEPPEEKFPTVEAYFRSAAEQPLRINAGLLAGGGVLRAGAAGFRPGSLSPEELRRVRREMERALGDGVLGVSLGLGYAPECFYSPEELLAALAPLHGSGVPITVHMRQEGDGVTDALAEMIALARELRTPVEISHLKAIGRRNWRSAVPAMLRAITAAREAGSDVSCDVYPYTAGSTQLIHVLPPEVSSGGLEALTARLRDPAERAAIRRRMETGRDFENITALCGFENVRATGLRRPENRELEGKSLAEIASAEGKDPFDALFDLLADEECAPSMIDFIAAEEDICDILRAPFTSVISDAIYPSAGLLHPRVYGMTAHLLNRYVRELGTLTLPEAVNRLTRRPADRLGLGRKGRLEPGADADLCLFDPARFRARSTYETPAVYAEGMDWVFVGGTPAVAEGRLTKAFSGKLLRRETR